MVFASNSVALGANSFADVDNVVSVGGSGSERRIINVAAGVNGTDVVNLNQLNAAIANAAGGGGGGSAFVAVHSDTATGDLMAMAPGADAVAIGGNAVADGDNSVVLGHGANDGGHSNTVVLGGGTATADNQVYVGQRKVAGIIAGDQADEAVNFGQLSATNTNVTALQTSVAMLQSVDAGLISRIAALEAQTPTSGSGNPYVAVNSTGTLPTATGSRGVGIGEGANAFGTDSVAIGTGAVARNGPAVSVGAGNDANGAGAVAIGDPNVATGTGAVAVGANNRATGTGAVALGNLSVANGNGAVAIGNVALAGTDGVAIGNGASNATYTNSIALGKNSVNTANNQVNVGDRTISGVHVGAISATSTEAINGSQLYDTNRRVQALETFNADITGKLNDQSRRINKANEGVAMALALDSPNVPAGASFALSGGIGGYQGKHALATAISAAVGEMTTLSAGFGIGLDTGEVGYRAGFQVAF